MKKSIKSKSSKSSAGINFYQFLNKYFFLLFGVTCLSVVTTTAIIGNRFCPTNSYAWKSTSSNSLNNNTLAAENLHKSLTWLYAIIILGCSATPWLLAYIFRHKALLTTKKKLRSYPSAAKTQTLKQKPIPSSVLSTPRTPNSPTSAPSYRISPFKSSAKKNTSLLNNTKNIRLPFERLK